MQLGNEKHAKFFISYKSRVTVIHKSRWFAAAEKLFAILRWNILNFKVNVSKIITMFYAAGN